jgi:mannose-1-phosphate guanylyltransferase
MRAMVLCAGLGTRLRPLTNRWPKPAMPLLAGPLFRYSVASLLQADISQLAINTHHLPQQMEAVARAEVEGLTVSHEAGEILGTGGGIRALKSFFNDQDFVVLNGDVLFCVDLKPVIAAHSASKAAATMVLLPMPDGEKYNAVELDDTRAVRRIAGQGPGGAKLSPWHFTGVHVMTPAIFDFMAASGPEDINRDVYVRMMEKGLTIRGHILDGAAVYWSDLGTPQRYAATHQHLLFGQVPLTTLGSRGPFFGHPRSAHGNFWQHPTSRVHEDVKVAGPAFFGEACAVDEGARIGAAVSVGKNARVGRGARLNRVAVLEGASVPPGVELTDAIVSPEAVVSTLSVASSR